jgi:Zn-dependent membrane protease YugP
MLYVLVGLAVLAIVFGPALWARGVLAWHGDDRPDFPGTGGELARHLLDESGLEAVEVEATDEGDHYDPDAKAVRLSRGNLGGRSLTAVVVAAHEVGHALQDRDRYAPLETRTRLVKSTRVFERAGSVILLATPLLGALTRAPGLIALELGAGILVMSISVVIHAVTLPVEFDASFKRALPMLDKGGYLPEADLPAARRILKACALTYVASSLASLLNLWRWIRLLR